MNKNEQWLKWAVELQAIAQGGLFYGKDKFDIERYERIREISAEMISYKTEISTEKVQNLFCSDVGYQTPKIDTRAAIFKDGKYYWFMKQMVLGHYREVGVMLIFP